MRDGRREQARRSVGVVGIGHKQKLHDIAFHSGVHTFDLIWPLEPMQATQFIVYDSDDRAGASSIIVGVVGIFGDSCKHHCAIRQSRRVGEAERNSIDLPKVECTGG